MIDTWARHLAAVGEARRLILMVLENNPAFRALSQSPVAAGQPTSVLSADVHCRAYVHLNEALAALRHVPSVGEAAGEPREAFSARIADIAPAALATEGSAAAVEEEQDALSRLRQRLRYVLGEPEAAPADVVAVAPDWAASGEEARVAIVRPGANGQ